MPTQKREIRIGDEWPATIRRASQHGHRSAAFVVKTALTAYLAGELDTLVEDALAAETAAGREDNRAVAGAS